MTDPGAVLVCDDDPSLLELCREILDRSGHRVTATTDSREAAALLEGGRFDLMLADLVMPGLGGLELLAAARRHSPETVVMIMTGHGDIDTAVSAIKAGAYDFITKPFHPGKLALDVAKAMERRRLTSDLEALRRADGRDRLGDLLGSSPAMQTLFRRIEQVAPTGSTVMILGDSGTGKERTAREIHRHSSRASGPFIAISCGTLPSSLLESELFGHTRGAFTGAGQPKAGLFEAASGGTIFLDEIGETTPQAQVGLLRVLQEREVRRVGSTESRKVDVRVIAATNVDLERAMDAGRFRNDLYYRLNTVTLRIPPLRERVEDIPPMAAHFLSRFAESLGRPARAFSPRALEMLCTHSWPGNVRELEHVVEHAVIFCQGEVIRPKDLPEPLHRTEPSDGGLLVLSSLADVERSHIDRILRHTNGNKLKAARILKIPRASLYRRIEKYELDPRTNSGDEPEPVS